MLSWLLFYPPSAEDATEFGISGGTIITEISNRMKKKLQSCRLLAARLEWNQSGKDYKYRKKDEYLHKKDWNRWLRISKGGMFEYAL